jgi:YesN/AraC family two-component response regulator
MSRIAIEAGANAGEILSLSDDFISEIDNFVDQDELNVWISRVMHNFIFHIFDLRKVKTSDVVFKVREYIKSNCDNKLTLDALAKQVYLSKSYLSSIFKQETG